ncbi:MAG: RecX family transcriptional regulator [Anaerolineales bacterium]|nr:RecX family transcriptional regulator [Anaerolineales bacterium]
MAEPEKRITDIQVQKRDPERVSIFLNGEFAFGLTAKLADPLSVGMLLSAGEITSLQLQDQTQKALQLSWDQLSRRPRTEKEIREYLGRKQVPDEVVDSVIDRLKQLDYVNDASFAAQWIENRQTFRPRSSIALKYELQQKGVANDIIASALLDFENSDAAYAAAEAAMRKFRNRDPETIQKRIYAYLSRRGFRYETIRAAVDRLSEEQKNEYSNNRTG